MLIDFAINLIIYEIFDISGTVIVYLSLTDLFT